MKVIGNKELMVKRFGAVATALLLFYILLAPYSPPVEAQEGEGARDEGYTLLAPLPGYVDKTTKPGPYIAGIFTLGVAAAGALAVVMIIFGGIKYMSTEAFTGKGDARKTIEHALWGLLLAIGAWVILYTINPRLVEFNLSIPPPQQPAQQAETGTTNTQAE